MSTSRGIWWLTNSRSRPISCRRTINNSVIIQRGVQWIWNSLTRNTFNENLYRVNCLLMYEHTEFKTYKTPKIYQRYFPVFIIKTPRKTIINKEEGGWLFFQDLESFGPLHFFNSCEEGSTVSLNHQSINQLGQK